jgi:hypothetical protein
MREGSKVGRQISACRIYFRMDQRRGCSAAHFLPQSARQAKSARHIGRIDRHMHIRDDHGVQVGADRADVGCDHGPPADPADPISPTPAASASAIAAIPAMPPIPAAERFDLARAVSAIRLEPASAMDAAIRNDLMDATTPPAMSQIGIRSRAQSAAVSRRISRRNNSARCRASCASVKERSLCVSA